MNFSSESYVRALTIAGSDSGGGAGIQADLKTFSALGAYGLSVVTALTAQNTQGVRSIFEVSPSFVGEQLDAVFEDIGVDAVKIGMLHDPRIIEVVADRLGKYRVEKVVLDPVMVAKSGSLLLKPDAIAALKEKLFPLATVVTPNLPEACALLGCEAIDSSAAMEEAAQSLLKFGPRAIFLKGGHLIDSEESPDCLALPSSRKEIRITWLKSPRVPTRNTHGTGCTLSSAIAAHLAYGSDLEPSCIEAKNFLLGAIRAGARRILGHGQGPVHHFFKIWPDSGSEQS